MQGMTSKTIDEPGEVVSSEVVSSEAAAPGLEIWKRRMRLNVSCAALAARAVVAEGVLWNLERWQKPVTPTVLARLEQALAAFAAEQAAATRPADDGAAGGDGPEP